LEENMAAENQEDPVNRKKENWKENLMQKNLWKLSN
jgi:hypothetical protein